MNFNCVGLDWEVDAGGGVGLDWEVDAGGGVGLDWEVDAGGGVALGWIGRWMLAAALRAAACGAGALSLYLCVCGNVAIGSDTETLEN